MKFHSNPVEEHGEVPLADDGQLEDVLHDWSQRHTTGEGQGSACYVVSVADWRSAAHREAQLGEILGLVEAHGDRIVGHESLRPAAPNPKTWLGRGQCVGVAERARLAGADLLVVDAALSPSQMRNLEDATGFSVHDREGIILGVFRRHARSRKARIQVEIAHLEYLRPRIRGLGLDMDQQAGGIMQGKGAGETASELMARRIDGRLAQLRRAFTTLKKAGALQRSTRGDCERIALVGYTNAGKTSLMNALTGAGLSARDRPFETLDTTSRCLTRHGGDVLIGDTVGFIRELPERLLASFETTLAEIREATLLALVVDLSDPEWLLHLESTHEVIARLDATEVPRFYVFNKVDLLPEPPTDAQLRAGAGTHPFAAVSSLDAEAVADLRASLLQTVRRQDVRATLVVPYAASAVNAAIHASCRVLESTCDEHGMTLTVEGRAEVMARIARALAEVSA